VWRAPGGRNLLGFGKFPTTDTVRDGLFLLTLFGGGQQYFADPHRLPSPHARGEPSL
jgi:hypothetical protein